MPLDALEQLGCARGQGLGAVGVEGCALRVEHAHLLQRGPAGVVRTDEVLGVRESGFGIFVELREQPQVGVLQIVAHQLRPIVEQLVQREVEVGGDARQQSHVGHALLQLPLRHGRFRHASGGKGGGVPPDDAGHGGARLLQRAARQRAVHIAALVPQAPHGQRLPAPHGLQRKAQRRVRKAAQPERARRKAQRAQRQHGRQHRARRKLAPGRFGKSAAQPAFQRGDAFPHAHHRVRHPGRVSQRKVHQKAAQGGQHNIHLTLPPHNTLRPQGPAGRASASAPHPV